jgi:hypothetical protein
MGPLMVKLGAEVIEPQLLGGQVGQWRLGGFRFEGLEHACVTRGFASLNQVCQLRSVF